MSIKFSHEATTQATPLHPSLTLKSSPMSRDVLRISTSLSSAPSGSRSEIVTVTADYQNQSPDTGSTFVDIVDHNEPVTLPKFNMNNRSLQFPSRNDSRVRSVVTSRASGANNQSDHNTLHRRWNFKKCFKCISPSEDEPDSRPYIRDAPPTYSSIYNDVSPMQNRRRTFPFLRDRSSFVAPIPPPSYAQSQGISLAAYPMDQLLSMSPNTRGMWSRRPTAAICPRCATIIITNVELRRTAITHLSALTLFLFGLPERRRLWQLNDERSREIWAQNTSRNNPHQKNQNIGSTSNGRENRLLSLFTVVKFDNSVCGGLSGENGTCISASECSQRGGVSSGICANGYGVCCIVTVSCGQTTGDNNTYFVNMNYPSSYDGTGSCQLTLIKSHRDVCQYRLDFDQFNLRGPETVNNVCIYDQFIVSGGNPVPAICGYNNGNHMYIDAGIGQTNPVTLTVVTSGASFSRMWKIRISQIPCSTIYRAEEGCLQYFTGVSGQIKSFNYEPRTGLQLSNQDYSICIRMERNFCGIQYMACSEQLTMPTTGNQPQMMPNTAFTLTGNTQATQIASMTGSACQTDWLTIPCATNLGRLPSMTVMCVDRLCGGTFNAESQNLNSSTVISTVKPFRLIFHTDSVEAPNDVGNRGFCLNYIQQPCTTRLT